jgi:TRAP-type C4-dicarboxylate transport system permease large subunit
LACAIRRSARSCSSAGAVGKVSIEQVMHRIWPFYAAMFVVLMFVTYNPDISLWRPRQVLR